eukprot:scaffold1483_cov374-Pavlova_lutheri.AAC.15
MAEEGEISAIVCDNGSVSPRVRSLSRHALQVLAEAEEDDATLKIRTMGSSFCLLTLALWPPPAR